MGLVSSLEWSNGETPGDCSPSSFAPPGDNRVGGVITRGGDDGACSPSCVGGLGEGGWGVSGGVCSCRGAGSAESLAVCSSLDGDDSGGGDDRGEAAGVGLVGPEGIDGSGVVVRVGVGLDVVGEPFRRAISASAVKS